MSRLVLTIDGIEVIVPIVTEQVIVSVVAAIDPWHRAAVLVTIICASTTAA